MRARFACHTLCGHSNEMSRPHLTCLFCRVRKYFYGKCDRKYFHYNRLMRIVMPGDCSNYVLFIDNKRHLAPLKAAILKRLLTICEWLAN
jgi:hypothetical protein